MPEPNIVKIEQNINVVGMMTHTTAKTIYKDLPKLYAEFMKIKEAEGIPGIKEPWEYISLSKGFQGKDSWDYYTGYVVNSTEQVLENLILFSAPAGEYAVFPLRCKHKASLGMKMGKMKKYIYTKWLPVSGYEFSGYEYEYNNEEMNKKSPYDIDLYIGITTKDKEANQ